MTLNFKSLLFQSGAGFIITLMGAQITYAQSNSNTNTGNLIDHRIGDDQTFKNSGTITSSMGVAALTVGKNNNIVNLKTGKITTTKTSTHGIIADIGNIITNRGLIKTEGLKSSGFYIGDENTINNYGLIETKGFGSYGLYIRDENTINNYGLIETKDFGSYGLYIMDRNTINNYGLIETKSSAYAIYAENNNRINNYGFLKTNLRTSVFLGNNNVLNNHGLIKTKGLGSHGLHIGDENTVNNYGLIETKDFASAIHARSNNRINNYGFLKANFGVGVSLYNNNVLNNHGLIEAGKSLVPANSSQGITANDKNTIINTGSIHVKGRSNHGIYLLGSGNTVIDSGRIVSEQGYALYFGGPDNTLIFQAPSFIGGRINLGTNTKLNIQTGRSYSVLWTFEGTLADGRPKISGSVPYLYNANTKQFATYDPTTLSADVDTLAETSSLVSRLAQRRLGRRAGGIISNLNELNAHVTTSKASMEKKAQEVYYKGNSPKIYYKGEKEEATVMAGNIPEQELFNHGAWLSILGGKSKSKASNTLNEYDLSYRGVGAGYDWTASGDLKIGVMGGYLKSNMKAESFYVNSFDNEASGFFAGLYARKQINRVFLDFALSGGISEHKSKRFINNNLADVGNNGGSLGESFGKGKYNSFWFAPEIAVGTHYDMGKGWISSPSARFRYVSQWAEGYSETGLSEGVKIDSHRIALGEAGLEWAATRANEKGSFTGRVGYLYRASFGEDTKVSIISQTISIPDFYKNHHIAYVGADIALKLTETLNLNLGGQAKFAKDYKGFDGTIALTARF